MRKFWIFLVILASTCLLAQSPERLRETSSHVAENAWILSTNTKNTVGQLTIQTVQSKIELTVDLPEGDNIAYFAERRGYIIPVDFRCAEITHNTGECDFSKRFTFFLAGKEANIHSWKFLLKPDHLLVAHGPGDEKGSYEEGLIIEGKLAGKDFFLQLRSTKSLKNTPLEKMKRDDPVEFIFRENDPYHAEVLGVELEIVVFSL